MRLQWPLQRRGARILYATDGRDTILNDPDGCEVSQPWLWWAGPGGGDGTGGPWGNPLPGANGRGAWALPAVTRCTNLIASTLAGLPWELYRDRVQLDTPRWIRDPQLTRPDDRVGNIRPDAVRYSAVEFWTQWISSALWWGDGYVWAPVLDASGQPIPPLWQLHHRDVKIEDDRYFVTNLIDADNGLTLPDFEISAENMLHLRGNPPYRNGHGTGVLDIAAPELGLAAAVRQYATNQFSSGVPAGYLKVNAPNMTQPQADELKAAWMKQHGGRSRSIAVLNATTDFTPIALSPVDAQLAQARDGSLRDIALAFGIPAWYLDVQGSSDTYSNIESRATDLLKFSQMPWVRRIESALDCVTPTTQEMRINTAELERGDTTTRYAEYTAGLAGGWLTVDEVRAAEYLPPMTDLDSAVTSEGLRA